MRRLLLCAVLVLAGTASVAHAQNSDTLPPVLDASQSGLSASAVDVTGGPATVTVRLFVTDDLSGVTFTSSLYFYTPAFVLRSPTGIQNRRVLGTSFALVDGDDLAGGWQADVTIPQWAESGTWTVESVFLQDKVGNTATLDTATLDAMGFATSLEVTSVQDTEPPTLTELSFTPVAIDTSDTDQLVAVQMHLTDAVSGAEPSYASVLTSPVLFLSPSKLFGRGCGDPVLVDGTAQDGTWSADCYFPRYSQAGDWTASLYLSDVAGNTIQYDAGALSAGGFPTTFALTSTPSDTTLPVLHSITFVPNFIDTSASAQTVTFTTEASDDLSGFSAVQMLFQSPSGGQQRWVVFGPWDTISGDPLHGVFTGTDTFPQYSESGTWRVQALFYYDVVFNYKYVAGADTIAALGFPTILNVVKASLIGDGTIGPDGGTVVDATFLERASVTLPPGAVAEPTDVAIDVLESALTFPMPIGFAAPGTRFVNISFTPYPHMPFPAPGATIVLPLVNPMPPGDCLVLYRVNADSGELEPAVSVSGDPVVGCVGPDGLSVTFSGVSRLSLVVGLIPDHEAPTVTAPADVTVSPTEAGGARGSASSALAAFLAGGSATDDIDASPVRLSPQVAGADVTNATLFPLGETTVTFRFRDTAQNIGTATAKVKVTPPPDVVPPVVTPPADISVEATQAAGASASTSAALAAFLGGGTAVDDVDPSPVKLTPQVSGGDVANTTLFGLGTTTVTFRFKDASDNVGSATAIVTVVDTKAPVVSAPASIAIAATESGGARPADSAALAALLAGGSGVDVADASPVRLTPQVGGIDVTPTTLFPLGVTTVTFRFRDAAGNTGTATASVTVSAGTPRLRAAITSQALVSAGVHIVTLTLSNTGTGNARAVTVTALGFKTLSGTGAVSLSGPATPMAIGSVDAGGSTVVTLTLDVPATVKRFSITENGTYTDVKGKKFSFSLSQSLIPKF